jgi:hypothetical protein
MSCARHTGTPYRPVETLAPTPVFILCRTALIVPGILDRS